MKLTLFTISNEQIKEQLSKLQTKVESLETVKEVQDKIIATKDSQIAFLNGQIANISTWVSIAAAVAGLIASFALGYVTYLNKKANKTIEEGKERDRIAEDKITKAETLIQKAQSSATIAQEKYDELDKKQKELTILTNTISIYQKSDVTLKNINFTLNQIKHAIDDINSRFSVTYFKPAPDTIKEFSLLCREYDTLLGTHMKLEMELTRLIQTEQEISEINIQNIETLKTKVEDFNLKLISFIDRIYENKESNPE